LSSAEGRRYVRTDQFGSLKEHVVDVVKRFGARGATTPEIVTIVNDETPDEFSTYSNPVSGALSRSHNVDGTVVRLKQRRGGFNIYVTPMNVGSTDDYYAPRPPNGMEGDRLTPFLVLEVLEGLSELHQKYPKDSLGEVLNRVWADAKAGDVADIQAAADDA
jgi:hypothetical protein